MPSRVASSLVASLKSRADSLITHTVQEYEEVVVRLCKSPSLRQAMKLSIAKQLLSASTFNKISMQVSLEQSYQEAWEVRNLMKIHQRSLEDRNEIYHRVLPHIIGESVRPIDGTDEMFMRGMELIQFLSCERSRVETRGQDQQAWTNWIRDSDSAAISDRETSIISIRHRLILGGVEQNSRLKDTTGQRMWHEALYDPCVFRGSCSMCRSSNENLQTKTIVSTVFDQAEPPTDLRLSIQNKIFQALHFDNDFNISDYLHREEERVIFTRFLYQIRDSTNLLQLLQVVTNFLFYLHNHTSKTPLGPLHLAERLFHLLVPFIFSQQWLPDRVEVESLLRYLPKSSSSDQIKREAMKEILKLINSSSESTSRGSILVYVPAQDIAFEGSSRELALILEYQLRTLDAVSR
jgi:hypothetical protein